MEGNDAHPKIEYTYDSEKQHTDKNIEKVNQDNFDIGDNAKENDDLKEHEQVVIKESVDKKEINEEREDNEQNKSDKKEQHHSSTENLQTYTDERTGSKYKYDTQTSSWQLISQDADIYKNEHYDWCERTNKWIPKATESMTETEHYRWDGNKQEWVLKTSNDSNKIYTVNENGEATYTDHDGVVFIWDKDKKAWFPNINDEMLALYQMRYGVTDNTDIASVSSVAPTPCKLATSKQITASQIDNPTDNAHSTQDNNTLDTANKKKSKPSWFQVDPEHNTKVYVSNLPLDITLDEFAELMGKYGMIMRDPKTNKLKLKLYAQPHGELKGDGLCDYMKVESVDLALNILHEYNYRGHKLSVERAKFEMRGDYNPSLKPKRLKSDKEKLKKMKEKLFDWRPERMRGERAKHERIVIIKNYFNPKVFEEEVHLLLEYQNNLREECSKCGLVRKVVLYDRHEEGVAQVNMSTAEEADLVIQMMQGRLFGNRQLTADHWDGKTKYKNFETETEEQKRLLTWDMFLESDEAINKPEDADEKKSTTE